MACPKPPHTPPNKLEEPPKVSPPGKPARNRNLAQFDVPRGSHLLERPFSPQPDSMAPTMAPHHIRRRAQYQEMLDDLDPSEAQQKCDEHFMDRLPYAQAASRRLQSRLEIFDGEKWPIPPLPEDRKECHDTVLNINSERVQSALDDCKDYAVDMSRDSRKGQILDVAMKKRIQAQRAAPKPSQSEANTAASQQGNGPNNTNSTSMASTPEPLKKKKQNKKKASKKDKAKKTDDNALSGLSYNGTDDDLSEELAGHGEIRADLLGNAGSQQFEQHSTHAFQARVISSGGQQGNTDAIHDNGMSVLAEVEATASERRYLELPSVIESPDQGPDVSVESGTDATGGITVPQPKRMRKMPTPMPGAIDPHRFNDRFNAAAANATATYRGLNFESMLSQERSGQSSYNVQPNIDDEGEIQLNDDGETVFNDDNEITIEEDDMETGGSRMVRANSSAPQSLPINFELEGYDWQAAAAAYAGSPADSTPSEKRRRWEIAMAGYSDDEINYDEDGNTIYPGSRTYTEDSGDFGDDDGAENNLGVGANASNDSCISFEMGNEEDDGTVVAGSNQLAAPSGSKSANPDDLADRTGTVDSRSFQEKLDQLPASKGMEYLNHTIAKFPAKLRTPVVPQPQNMPGTLTQALCNWTHMLPTRILTLTLEDVTRPIASPRCDSCVLLHHFEVGLDGVEAIIVGHVQIQETDEMKKYREERLPEPGRMGGKGLWLFFGVRFKQTSKEKKLRKPARWVCFSIPLEASSKVIAPARSKTVTVMLGGGVSRSGAKTGRYQSRMVRTSMLWCKGGVAPMDTWDGAEQWEGGVLQKVRAAMAHNGLRISYLQHEDETQRATDKFTKQSKRKGPCADMTAEEDYAALMKLAKAEEDKKPEQPVDYSGLAVMVLEATAKQRAEAAKKASEEDPENERGQTNSAPGSTQQAAFPFSGGRPSENDAVNTTPEAGQRIPRTGGRPSRFFTSMAPSQWRHTRID